MREVLVNTELRRWGPRWAPKSQGLIYLVPWTTTYSEKYARRFVATFCSYFRGSFGELQVHVLDQYRHPRYPEIYVSLERRQDWQDHRYAPGQGHSGVAFGSLVPASAGAGDHPLRHRSAALERRYVVCARMARAESEALLERLMQHSTQDRFVLRHRWEPRDVVMWDNRCTMHCATPYDAGAERRVIHRTVVKGDVPR